MTSPAQPKFPVRPHQIGTKLPQGGRKAARKQACYLQQVTYDTAMELKETFDRSTNPEERARLAASLTNTVKAWDMTRERIRILDGDPMPGSLRPVAKPKKVRLTSTVPLESIPSDTTPVRTDASLSKPDSTLPSA